MSGKFPILVRWPAKKSTKDPNLVLTVPKKAVKIAAHRNLLKRRLRVIFKPFLNNLLTFKVFAGVGSDKLTFKELKENLLNLLKNHERNI
jgi:ribonuclease P protein component